MKQLLKIEILDRIKEDPILFGKVAEAAGLSVFSMPNCIKKNSPKFTKPPVMKVLQEHLKFDTSKLLQRNSMGA